MSNEIQRVQRQQLQNRNNTKNPARVAHGDAFRELIAQKSADGSARAQQQAARKEREKAERAERQATRKEWREQDRAEKQEARRERQETRAEKKQARVDGQEAAQERREDRHIDASLNRSTTTVLENVDVANDFVQPIAGAATSEAAFSNSDVNNTLSTLASRTAGMSDQAKARIGNDLLGSVKDQLVRQAEQGSRPQGEDAQAQAQAQAQQRLDTTAAALANALGVNVSSLNVPRVGNDFGNLGHRAPMTPLQERPTVSVEPNKAPADGFILPGQANEIIDRTLAGADGSWQALARGLQVSSDGKVTYVGPAPRDAHQAKQIQDVVNSLNNALSRVGPEYRGRSIEHLRSEMRQTIAHVQQLGRINGHERKELAERWKA